MKVRLDFDTKVRLQMLGAIKNRSPQSLMREAITRYLGREEAAEEERRITGERWKHYEKTGKTIDHAYVSEWIEKVIAGDEPPPSSQ